MKFRILPAIFCLAFYSVSAQEVEVPLNFNAAQARQHTDALRYGGTNRGGGALPLPFFDDFSRYSLPPIDGSTPAEWQQWIDTSVFINCTFPVAPLTIGVATFDGLKANGHPYEWDAADEIRGCDTLTSLPIDLQGLDAEDQVHLLFYYQEGGWGNSTEQYDTLYLDFYTPEGGGGWINVWKMQGGMTSDTFEQVFMPITDPLYFNNEFRMRFRNLGRPGGSVDHWHLDYLLLSEGLDPGNFQFDEVAFEYCENTLLNFGYTSMPWTHYLSNPSSFMVDDITVRQRNLGPSEQNVASQFRISDVDGGVLYQTTANNPNAEVGEITQTFSLDGYTYDAISDEGASFTVCATFSPTDVHLQNDTMCFDQVFENYYAYDDGTAESGWGMNAAGARAAMRFDCEIPDTLVGVMIHWLPFLYDHSEEDFLLRVYSVDGNLPGTEYNENDFQTHSVTYHEDGYNPLYFYQLTDPVALDGPFFLGWIQQDFEQVYIGNDKNTNMNPTNLFYKLNNFGNWTQSTITGSIMFRPVLKSGMPDWVGVDEQTFPEPVLYPNPASDELNIVFQANHESYSVDVLDMTGRILISQAFINNGMHVMDVSGLPEAAYLVRIVETSTGASRTRRFIKGQ